MISNLYESEDDIEDQLKRHNQERNKHTKSGIPWKLVYKEGFEIRSEAVKREKELKKQESLVDLVQVIHMDKNELNDD